MLIRNRKENNLIRKLKHDIEARKESIESWRNLVGNENSEISELLSFTEKAYQKALLKQYGGHKFEFFELWS